jgi:hypothetical protein
MEIFWIINEFLLKYAHYINDVATVSDSLYLGIVYSVMFHIITRLIEFKVRKRFILYIKIFIYLPGTIIHESMHYISSLITNGRPVRFTILPKFKKDKIILGSVANANITWYNSFIIGFAPLITLWLLILYADNYMNLTDSVLFALIQLFLFYIIAIGSVPSGQDVKVAFTYMIPGFILFVLLIFLFIVYFHIFSIDSLLMFDEMNNSYYPEIISEYIQKLRYFL